MEVVDPEPVRTQIANVGRSHAYYHHLYGISPNYLDALNATYLEVADVPKTAESVIKALYSNNGDTFSTSLSTGLRKQLDGHAPDLYLMSLVPEFDASLLNSAASFLATAATFLDTNVARYNITSNSYIHACPFLHVPAQTITATSFADAPLSIPSYLALLPGNAGHLGNIKYNHLFVTLTNNPDPDRRDALYNELKGSREEAEEEDSTYTIWEFYKALDDMKLAMLILNIVMIVVMVVVMILCFFSLMSSMQTNVMEQAKEIGIMRALGLTRIQMIRVFAEEAFVLVITATLMGMICGMIVGYLLTSQIATLQGLPADLYFPTTMVVVMLSIAVVTSVISALSPTIAITAKPIVLIIKTV